MDKQIEKFEFRVIDNNTGEEADIEEIAFTEDWANGLIYCDMEGFAILENGSLVLLDECGNCAYCPSGRFAIIPENAVVIPKEISCYRNVEKRIKTFKIDGNKVDFTDEQIMALTQIFHMKERDENEIRKETAEKFAEMMRCEYIDFNDYDEISVGGLREDISKTCKKFTEGKANASKTKF
jgi:hypothetical protein